jgi:hypothetical protein
VFHCAIFLHNWIIFWYYSISIILFSVKLLALFFESLLGWKGEIDTQFNFLLSFCFGTTGGWSQGFAFAKQVLSHLNPSTSPFCNDCFSDRVSLYTQTSMGHRFPICVSWYSWNDRSVSSCRAIAWNCVLWTFCCPGWPHGSPDFHLPRC